MELKDKGDYINLKLDGKLSTDTEEQLKLLFTLTPDDELDKLLHKVKVDQLKTLAKDYLKMDMDTLGNTKSKKVTSISTKIKEEKDTWKFV